MLNPQLFFHIGIFLFIIGNFSLYAESSKIRVACIGDSITFGGGIKERLQNNYPANLQNLLGGKYIVKNFGVGGATILRESDKPYWKQKAFWEALQFLPDIAIIKFGTNDSKSIHWNATNYRNDYSDFIIILKKLNPKMKIYLCSPVPAFIEIWNIQPSVVEKEIRPIVESIARKEEALFIDLFAEFLSEEELFFDKIHPDSRGAKLIAEIVFQAMKNSIGVE